MKRVVFFQFILLFSCALFAMDLTINQEDTLVIQNPDGGYDLYIKKKPDINSVLITESTKDYRNIASNYAYRDPVFNPVNGNEKRMLNGEFLPKENKLYSLIDSTPELNTPIGYAFHIWIPFVVEFGYEWTRHGQAQVLDGTFLNIRCFEKPYADYEGNFKDNPFVLRVTQEPLTPPEDDSKSKYMEEAVKSFDALAKDTDGIMYYAKGPEDIVPLMREPLKSGKEDNLQLVFVIDATASMSDDIAEVRKSIKPVIEEAERDYKKIELGIVLYKDYDDAYLTRRECNFTTNTSKFYGALSHFSVGGGKDIPEAVYEGIYDALSMNWKKDVNTKKIIILIGDAPPHAIPRGKITKELINKKALEEDVSIYPIILPHKKTK